jgi:hypothetical protein
MRSGAVTVRFFVPGIDFFEEAGRLFAGIRRFSGKIANPGPDIR